MRSEKNLPRYLRFVEIAQSLEKGLSFREIANNLNISNSTVSKTLDQLEDFYGVALASRESSHGDSRLTQHGRDLLQRIVSLVDWHPGSETTELTVAIPQALLNSQLVTRGINEYLSKSSTKLNLVVRSIPDSNRMAGEVEAGLVDIAIAWHRLDSSLNMRSGAASHHCPRFGVVLMSHSVSLLELAPKTIFETSDKATKLRLLRKHLSDKRVVTMNRANQPLPEVLEGGDKQTRIRVDDLDSAIAALASRVADYAVVPELRSHLQQHQHSGRLCWSAPIGSIEVSFLTRSESVLPAEGRTFIESLKTWLEAESQFGCKSQTHSFEFPNDPQEIERLSVGYYIDQDRSRAKQMAEQSFVAYHSTRWRWESLDIKWQAENKEPGENLFRGSVRNMHGDYFELFAMLSVDSPGRLVASARQLADAEPTKSQSVPSFITVLTRRLMKEDNCVLAGIWIGLDQEHKPATYAAMWAQHPLTATELQELSTQFWSRTVLSADCIDDFDRHIENWDFVRLPHP